MPHPALRGTPARPLAGVTADYAPLGPGSRRDFSLVRPWMTSYQVRVASHPAFVGRITIPDDPHGCWEWTRLRHEDGYGRLRFKGRQWYAHRLSRFVAFGDQPEAACHHCDNPPCVNPEHLRSGTLADNCAEMWAKGRARSPVVCAKLTPEQVAYARAAYRPGLGLWHVDRIAAALNVSRRTIYRLCSERGCPQVYRPSVRAAA